VIMEGGRHRRNEARNGGGGSSNSTMLIRNFNLRSSQFKKRGEIDLNQSLIYIHPFSPLSPIFFILPSSNDQSVDFLK
jgi:hypothetical protein